MELLPQLPQPHSVFKYFFEVCALPHGSNNMGPIRDRLAELAKSLGAEVKTDSTGNLIIYKPASPGSEDKPAVCLQGHMDMVNQKNDDVTHDFDKDPIRPRIEGPYLKATGTSLGADNGIGVAAALAILEDKTLKHPALEILITRDEEIGLIGAANMEPNTLKSAFLINLDSEEEDAICIGCAGGFQMEATLEVQRIDPPADMVPRQVSLSGFNGGHSGVDIHTGRGNPLKVIARLLRGAHDIDYLINSYDAGTAHNAIPRSAVCNVLVPAAKVEAFEAAIKKEWECYFTDYKPVEANAKLTIGATASPLKPIDRAATLKLVDFMHVIPYGVMRMSPVVKDLVETSYTPAIIKTTPESFTIIGSPRSSSAHELELVFSYLKSLCALSGFKMSEKINDYPGWAPDVENPLLESVKISHKEVHGVDAKIYAIHAGLECGLLQAKHPAMKAVSIGPLIEYPHSPDERLTITTVPQFYNVLVKALERLA